MESYKHSGASTPRCQVCGGDRGGGNRGCQCDNGGVWTGASRRRRDLRTIETALTRAEHSRSCEGFYRCTCIVGKAEAALDRLKEASRV